MRSMFEDFHGVSFVRHEKASNKIGEYVNGAAKMITLPKIFLSYTRKDKQEVESLYRQLIEAGFRPWMDIKDILPGEKWEHSIEKAIKESDFFIACISNNSVNRRGFLQKEIRKAKEIWEEKLENDIYLIPVRLQHCEVPETLRAFQYVDLFEKDGMSHLIKAIKVGVDRLNSEIKAGMREYPVLEEDMPFVSFWEALIDNRKLIIIHAVPVDRPEKHRGWPKDKDREGINLLTRTFSDKWPLRNPIEHHSSAEINVEHILPDYDILMSGGAVSNCITRKYFNHFTGLRYVIDYSMPNYADIWIYDRTSASKISATYQSDEFGNRAPAIDIGILTVMQNPMNTTKSLIGCMGIHGFGSLSCLKVLSEQILLQEFKELIKLPLTNKGYQILVEYDTIHSKPKLLSETLHKIPE